MSGLSQFFCAGTGLQPVPERLCLAPMIRKRCGRGCKPRPAKLIRRAKMGGKG